MDTLNHLFAKFRCLLWSEEGQDLVEYALLIALISLGTVSATSALASHISSFFVTTGTRLSSAVA